MRDSKYFETYYNLRPGQWNKQVIKPTSSTKPPESPTHDLAYIEAEDTDDVAGSTAVARHALRLGGLLLLGVIVQPNGNWNVAYEQEGFRSLFVTHYKNTGNIRCSVQDGVPYNHLAKEKTAGVVIAKLQRV